jgi:hypothetical protein
VIDGNVRNGENEENAGRVVARSALDTQNHFPVTVIAKKKTLGFSS